MSAKPNVLLISIDTLRADHVSCYGYERPTTPSLDALAADGTRFAHAYSPAGWTPPAHASMLTGLFPTQHGAVDENRLHDEVPTVAEILAGAGYRTCGVVNNSQVGALVGLDRGHHDFHEVWKGHGSKSIVKRGTSFLGRKIRRFLGREDKGVGASNRIVREWWAAHAGKDASFYTFIHYIEPHNPIQPPRAFRKRFGSAGPGIDHSKMVRVLDNPLWCFADDVELSPEEIRHLVALYDAEIAHLDARLGELLAFMKQRGLYDDTLIIVTADHGEHFGEHGMYSHVASLYEPVVHVPLIVKWPRGATGPAVRDELVQLTDIVPTILEVAGVPAPHQDKLFGKSLTAHRGPVGHEFIAAEWEGRIPFFLRRTLGESRAEEKVGEFKKPFRMIREGRYKYISRYGDRVELYDLESDPGENINLADRETTIAEALGQKLDRWKESARAHTPEKVEQAMDDEVRRHLEKLGYL
jgi:arylsulfatase A-like enzyme